MGAAHSHHTALTAARVELDVRERTIAELQSQLQRSSPKHANGAVQAHEEEEEEEEEEEDDDLASKDAEITDLQQQLQVLQQENAMLQQQVDNACINRSPAA